MFSFLGSAFTSAKSEPLPHNLPSEVNKYHDSPPSSLRYIPPFFSASTVAYILFELLGAMVKPIRPSPSCVVVGNPLIIFFQVFPPSMDLYKPLATPFHAPFSQGPCRADQMVAKTIFVLFGSIPTCTAPVFSSMYKTCCRVLPPSKLRYTPRSLLGP